MRLLVRLKSVFIVIICIGRGVPCAAALQEGDGPLLELEPPARLDFSNAAGGRLDCAARGRPAPAVRWLLGDGSAAGAVPGLRLTAANGSLLFPPFGAAAFRPDVHRQLYRCQATNALGRVVSRDVRVRAVVMQPFRVDAIGASVMQGNTAVLRCQVPAHVREYVTITSWVQDHSFNIYPSSDGDGKLHMLPSGELLVRGAAPADAAARFQCRVTHRLSGETHASAGAATLTVSEARGPAPPRFPQRLLSLEAKRDELAVLPCVAQGHPPPDYRWEAEGAPLAGDEQRYAAPGLLVLPRARPAHSGRYACEARNAAGSARLEINLLVAAPLSARVAPALLSAPLGRPAAFTCAAQGHPVSALHWLKDGQPLRPPASPSSGAAHVLALAAVSKDDQGMYQCVVKNEHDSAQGAAELRLGDTPPVLVYSFIRQTIQPGPSVSLKCVASGNPTPQIKWTHDGFKLPQIDRFVIGQYVPVNGDVVSHVNITNVRVEDGGTYQCTATNRMGEVSHAAKLNVYGSPYVRPMGEISAIAGENFLITCPVSGYPIDSVKWFRVGPGGDRPIPFNTRHFVFPNGSLVIENVQSGEDNGVYRCTATNKLGERSSSTADVNVTVPPKIIPFSFRSDLHLGDRIGVQCVVSRGDPPIDIHWLKDGVRLIASEREGVLMRKLDEFTSVLSISPLARRHGGNYTCVARNGAAQTAESAALSVNVPPAITPFAFGELSSGERVRVTCSVKRGDPPLTIRWLKDARPIPPTPGPHDDPNLTVHAPEEYSSVLAIRSVSSRHSGNYTCLVTNKARMATYTAQLLVTVPPTWVAEPQSGSAKLGEQALLDCKVEGFPQPVVVWKKASGRKVDAYQSLVTHESKSLNEMDLSMRNERMAILQNGSLFFESVTQEDQGQYICEARNGIGAGLSAVVELTVHAPVHFKVRSRKEMVRRRGAAVLRCLALGDLPITFTWRKEGSFMELQGSSMKNTSGGMESNLRIDDVHVEDGGIYTCYARNAFGHDQTTIHLLVQDAPEHPTNLRVLEQSSRRVTVAWTPAQDGNSPITRYVLRYHPVKGSWQGPAEEAAVEGAASSAALAGLAPATTYGVRVLAENSLGPGAPSAELRVRTDEEAPSAAPRALRAEAQGAATLALAWEAPPPDAWHGALLGHYVGFRLLGDNENRKYNFTTVPFNINGRQETQLNDLKKFSKYGVVVQAFNSKGPGPLSDEVTAQTLEDVPEASPRDVRCTALSPESLQVSWQPPPEALVHGVIQGYRLAYEPASLAPQDDDVEPSTKVTTALTTVLYNLLKYTNYSIEILAFTSIGDGVKSPKVYCRTKEDAPGAPAGIKAALAQTDVAVVTWQPPAHPNGHVLKYHVHVRVVEGAGGRQVDARSVPLPASPPTPSAPLLYRLASLRRPLRYEFWVTAFTQVGEGQSTPVVAVVPSNKVSARIVSFGGVRVAAWRSEVRLPCQAVGEPEPSRRWQRPGDLSVSQQPRAHVLPDGALLLSGVQRPDQGEYVCEVSNEHGSDHVSHQLVVQVPPGAPVLLMTGSTQQSLQLQWKLGDNGGSRVRGFVLHYKHEHGEWEEVRVDGARSTHSLTGLRCGTQYHVFITAFNAVGSGDPSPTLNVRTRGAVPLRPQSFELFSVNASSVTLHLNSWPDGGCPLFYFVVEYAQYTAEKEQNWNVVGNNIGTDRAFPVVGLNPGQTYKIRVTAHNAAGSTVALYKVKTLSEIGGTVSPSHVITRTEQRTPLHKDMKIVLLSVLSIVALVLSLLGVCFCLKKRVNRRPSPHPSVQDMQTTATQDNKHNLARSEKYYATIRKLSPSSGTLECIPEYSEDIRPYATFHVPSPPNSESTKLQTFVYRESDASPSRKSMKSDYRRGKRNRQSEEYDSFGSESDTEPGTSSRTESSNQLDSGGMTGDMGRFHHSSARLSKMSIEPIYPDADWAPPLDAPSGTERRPYGRKYCQAHHMK